MLALLIGTVDALVVNIGCDRPQETSESKRAAEAEVVERRMSQFAASNGATVLSAAPTNWLFALTSDIEGSLKKDGKPIAIELIVPDVRRDEGGALLLDAAATVRSIANVRVEAHVTTNMLKEIRVARSELSGLWLIMKIESVQKRPIANDNEEIVLRGEALVAESRPQQEWTKHIAPIGGN